MFVPSEKRRIGIFVRFACRASIAAMILAFSASLFAAEKPAAKTDPLLADLTLSAKAEWQLQNGSPQPPYLDINIEVQGKAAETTSAYGEIAVESAVDESGNRLDFLSGALGMQSMFRTPREKHFCVTLGLLASPSLRKIRELRGTMSLQTGGRCEIVAVKDLLKQVSNKDIPIDDATLKALGIVVKVEHQRNISPDYGGVESLNVDFRWKHIPVILCEIFDEDGELLPSDNCSISSAEWDPCWVSWRRVFKIPVPQTAQLRLVVHKDSRKIRVPFALKDIKVPPVPDEQDGAAGFCVPVPMEEKK